MTFFRSIKRQLAALVFLPFLVLAAIGATSAWSAWSRRVATEQRANLEMARAVASGFRTYVEGTRDQLAAVAQAIQLADRPATVARVLDEASQRRPSVRSVSWASADGRILQSSELAAVGRRVADRRYFQALLAGADWALGDLDPAVVDGAPVFAIAEAVRATDGRLVGAVVAVIDANRLEKVALLQRSGDAGIALVDSAGRLVMRSPRVELSWEERPLVANVEFVRRAFAGEEVAGDTVSMTTGERVIGAAVPIQPFGWVARAGRARAEVLAPIRRDIVRATRFSALAAALALFASVLASRRIASGLRRLEVHAENLGRGVRPERAVEGAAEIERLGRAFDDMAARLLAARAVQERLHAEVDLERRRLEQAFDAAPAGILLIDGRTGRARWCNATYLSHLDEPYRSRGIQGLCLDEFLPGARERGLVEILERVARDGEPYENPELRWEGFARGVTYYRWSSRPFPSAEGDGTDVLVLSTDITRLVQARLDVEAERRRVEAVLETLPVGVFIADEAGRLLHSNAVARAIPGAKLRSRATRSTGSSPDGPRAAPPFHRRSGGSLGPCTAERRSPGR